MKHLLVCPEFPPFRGGGIGTYAETLALQLASKGEVVHVIGNGPSLRRGFTETALDGRLVIHRIPWRPQLRRASELLRLPARPKPFARRAARLAERLVAEQGIDVIEAQEYEAPLYWFQRRRALGLGPRQMPPCIIHLHSPTRLIRRHNEQRPDRFARGTMRLERHSIRLADAHLAPSRELADWTETRYRLKAGSVHVIPYPLQPVRATARSASSWSAGSVCFVGRLEFRKGIVEWVDAAVRAAQVFGDQVFDFVGGDTRTADGNSVRAELVRRIPAELRPRFRFHGEQRRGRVTGLLAGARIAAVPSRWDNFPYVCMEAMAGGLPVLGTRTGGIAELVEPGSTGWLAEPGDADSLFANLRQALRTPPDELARMGARAAEAVRRYCDPDRVLDSHLEMRRQLCAGGFIRRNVAPAFAAGACNADRTAG
jgi:glycogen(starch) synthase